MIIQAFARLDKMALGIAVGLSMGLVVFIATVFLVVKGVYGISFYPRNAPP